ncbi:bola protein [Melanogaster broomeanus]|nr:bola protein [Melanogaster broomeanus]
MTIQIAELEQAIRDAFPIIDHLKIEDHYFVLLVSEAFEGKTTLARHRLVNETLKAQIAQMHAFSQKTFTPKQYEGYLAKGN